MKKCILFISLSCCLLLVFWLGNPVSAQENKDGINMVPVDKGWANNSINTVIFRRNALATFKDTQYISYYDQQHYVVLGKRKIGSETWQLKQTKYQGNVADAHNTISLMVDGAGYLHLAWDHHNNALRYCKSVRPGSLELTEKMPMTGKLEERVTYPEFYRMPGGDLLFFYRNGQSGQGDLVLNRYDVQTRQWTQLQHNFIDGQSQRSAYWQSCVDTKGTIHVSWVWRETPDVASNHDLAYARSNDGGKTWEKSTGDKYRLPITEATAEYALRIKQNTELINQTSMSADAEGNPYIATYWREEGSAVPQYHVVYRHNNQWMMQNAGFRKKAFSLSGAGTKSIPISRPQIITWKTGGELSVALIFRDAERGDKVSAAINKNIKQGKWKIRDLTKTSVGSWEPTYDAELWRERGMLHLFIQNVIQVDAEGKADVPPQLIHVLEWNPKD